ncbi:MAG: hypothetical protein HRT88_19660, partial [Lentisphaeraceae bacterium]|nr:hypothetical protein [Lentisphaeraceae bacterium]
MSDSDPAAFLKKLKDYPKRESRQSWSSYYQRMRSAQSELLDDPEIISEADFQNEVDPSKKVYLYRYHEGENKLRADSRIAVYEYRDGTYEGAKAIRGAKLKFIDPSRKLIFLTIPTKPVPQKVCVMPASPLNTRSISDSIARYAVAPSKYPAVNSILQRQPSLFKEDKKVILRHKDELINDIIRKAVNLDNSHFTVQGPPGTGKTYVGARIIL